MQAMLLFGSDMWEMTPRLKKALESFHYMEVRCLAGMGLKLQRDGTWVFPPIGSALATVGLDDIRVNITCCQNTVTP